jgi:AcrR family transcriptional regulator
MTAALNDDRDGRNARWDDHREQRRRHIVDAAVELVEELPMGAELTLQDVADKAGLVRTVVQRHFGGRLGLVRAVQADVVARAFTQIAAAAENLSTYRALSYDLVAATVSWVGGHPKLHVLVEKELGDGEPSELSRTITEFAEQLTALNALIASGFGLILDERQIAETRLLYIGLIGQVRATTTHWVLHDQDLVSAEALTSLLSNWILKQTLDLAARYGLEIDADEPFAGLVQSWREQGIGA